ncbi:MAG: ribosomal L7Ae/L30e/S12e/Gadd45 family protein [Clostridiales bacterium]
MNDYMDLSQLSGADKEKIGNYLGLAQKAGKIAAGDAAVQAAFKDKKTCLIFLASDAAQKVIDDLAKALEKRSLPVMIVADKSQLGLWVGKSHRGSLALKDQGFANAILKYCEKFL